MMASIDETSSELVMADDIGLLDTRHMSLVTAVKFLITNDDGIDAAGLEALVTAARTLGESVVVAPADPQSGVSHRVTWHDGVRIEPRGERRFAIHGTPADCVRLGLLKVLPDANWILSGINHGANLGADVHYSGTVAAVREAVLHGWPGIAVSHYRKSGVAYDWKRAAEWVTPILSDLLSRPVEPGLFYNVNLPMLPPEAALPEVVWCPLDPNPLPLNYRHEEESGLYYAGDYQLRPRTSGADVDICFGGRIAVTAVRLL
jgi:5'/3'-nucleotidase